MDEVPNLAGVLTKVEQWLTEVGQIQLDAWQKESLSFETKTSQFDLVTEIDKLSEELLIGKIKESYPGHAVLAEEAGADDEVSEYLWIIDPIDGTTNYAHHFPFFCISVALQYQKQTVLGVVYAPALREMFTAIRGQGAFLNGRRLAVSKTKELQRALVVTGFPYDKAVDPEHNNLKFFNRMMPRVAGIRRIGSAALDLCGVAMGRMDAYWELKLKPWDIAAGLLMVEEAGGRVVYLEGQKPIALVAGNDELCRLVLEELRQA